MRPTRTQVFSVLAGFVYLLLAGLLIELSLQLHYRWLNRHWLFSSAPDDPFRLHSLFQLHPYLAVAPRPATREVDVGWNRATYSHNSFGVRGEEFSATKKAGTIRVLALGGSTTYGLGVGDQETWPYLLQRFLGDKYEVINLGVHGYSTAENLIQTALWFSDLKPDIAVYFEGWNDMRSFHMKNLKGDYSDFHGPSQPGNLYQLGASRSKWAFLHYLQGIFSGRAEQNYPFSEPIGTDEKFTSKRDERALSIYERNLRQIAILAKAQGVCPVFMPQVLNYRQRPQPANWMPFVLQKDVKEVLGFYNDSMKKVAAEQSTPFVAGILKIPFSREDFLDNGHFSPSGNRKTASSLADFLLHSEGCRRSR